MMSGNVPISPEILRASSIVWATPDRGTSSPIRSMASLNFCRSSPFSIASAFAPIMRTPCFSSVPAWCRSIETLSAVCPPSVGSSASGFSLTMIFSMTSGVIGSM